MIVLTLHGDVDGVGDSLVGQQRVESQAGDGLVVVLAASLVLYDGAVAELQHGEVRERRVNTKLAIVLSELEKYFMDWIFILRPGVKLSSGSHQQHRLHRFLSRKQFRNQTIYEI